MAQFFIGLLLGILLGWLTLGSYLQAALGRCCARIAAVVLLGGGAALLVWAIVALALGETIRPILGLDVITQASEAIAWGSGLLAAGIVALVLSFLGRRHPGGEDPGAAPRPGGDLPG